MRVTVAKIDDNENEYTDKNFNVDIEQLDIPEQKFYEIACKIKNKFTSNEYNHLIIQFGTVYVRIYNLISYLKNNFLCADEVIEILLIIKNEIKYLRNDAFDNINKKFLSCVDEKSNLHKIDKLAECIDDLYILVKNQNVDK